LIDLHAHILPGLDDGAKNWGEALEMARLAEADGVTAIVATPHLFQHRGVYQGDLNDSKRILATVQELREKLTEAGVKMNIFPGCEAPLFPELLDLLHHGSLLTLNNGGRYLCLEMPDTVIPPATEDVVFQLNALGIIAIITHPERNLAFQEMPQKLVRFLQQGCLTQITTSSLLGRFGRRVAGFTEQLVKKGYVQIMASDAHNAKRRPPLLSEGLKKLARLVGEGRAWDMVASLPEKIVRGDSL